MLNQETVAAIKALKQQGKSIQGMTKELGLSRNTVKKYLPHKDCAQQYQRVGSKPGKPDPFKDYIRSRIEAAAPGRIPAAVP
ncbi:helix-turn-helix domain-containing protein, partial [Neisseria musculi]